MIFSVKYPLSKRDLDNMHSEFEKLDAEKMAEFNALKDGISDVDSILYQKKARARALALILTFMSMDFFHRNVIGYDCRFRLFL